MGIGARWARNDVGALYSKAIAALCGLSETPERDIANLLRSEGQITPEIRKKLADALEGKLKAFQLNCTAKSYAKDARRFLLLRKRLRIGRDVAGQIHSIGYDDAIKAGCNRYILGKKTVETTITLAKTVDAYLKTQAENQCYDYELEPAALELVYLYAKATNRKPSDCIRASASALPLLMEHFDRDAVYRDKITA